MFFEWFEFRNTAELEKKMDEGWECRAIHPFYKSWLMKRDDAPQPTQPSKAYNRDYYFPIIPTEEVYNGDR